MWRYQWKEFHSKCVEAFCIAGKYLWYSIHVEDFVGAHFIIKSTLAFIHNNIIPHAVNALSTHMILIYRYISYDISS